MAKKQQQASDKENVTKEKPDNPAGCKPCPSCGWWNRGTRRQVCLHCKAPFPASQATATKATPKKRSDEANVRETIAIVKKMGGLEKLTEQIKAAETAIDALAEFGGLQSAKEAEALVKDLTGLLTTKVKE